MYSVVLLISDGNDDPERAREIAARSLVWLVSAVVAGVVRDVVAACPSDRPIADLMEHAGGDTVQAASEPERLAKAAALVRCPRVLALRVGFQPTGPLVEELDAVERRLGSHGAALLLEAPSTPLQRLLPQRTPVVGVVLPRGHFRDHALPFRRLARTRGAVRLRTRMVPVL